MSRIEKALEKATKMRTQDNAAATVESGAPKVAHIPPKGHRGSSSRLVSVEAAGQEKRQAPPDVSPYIVVMNQPEARVTQEYKKLKSMVMRLTKQGGFKNTIMVTSCFGNEGKSITAANLACALSQDYDHTVLLIDADLRKPSLNGYLNIDSNIGLVDCLINGKDIGEAMVRVGQGNLMFLPAGKCRSDDVSDILSSKRMGDVLGEIKHRYSDRYIVIDTSPLLSFAETFSISAHVDGVLLVVREGVTSSSGLRDSLEMLGGTILGVVYNDVSVVEHYGNYYYHRYYEQAQKRA